MPKNTIEEFKYDMQTHSDFPLVRAQGRNYAWSWWDLFKLFTPNPYHFYDREGKKIVVFDPVSLEENTDDFTFKQAKDLLDKIRNDPAQRPGEVIIPLSRQRKVDAKTGLPLYWSLVHYKLSANGEISTIEVLDPGSEADQQNYSAYGVLEKDVIYGKKLTPLKKSSYGAALSDLHFLIEDGKLPILKKEEPKQEEAAAPYTVWQVLKFILLTILFILGSAFAGAITGAITVASIYLIAPATFAVMFNFIVGLGITFLSAVTPGVAALIIGGIIGAVALPLITTPLAAAALIIVKIIYSCLQLVGLYTPEEEDEKDIKENEKKKDTNTVQKEIKKQKETLELRESESTGSNFFPKSQGQPQVDKSEVENFVSECLDSPK